MVRPERSGNPYGIGPGRNWKKIGGLGGAFCGPPGPIKYRYPTRQRPNREKGRDPVGPRPGRP